MINKIIEKEFIRIEYLVEKDSFDHAFGTHKLISYKPVEVQIYCDAVGEFIILEKIPSNVLMEAMRLIKLNEEN